MCINRRVYIQVCFPIYEERINGVWAYLKLFLMKHVVGNARNENLFFNLVSGYFVRSRTTLLAKQ